jgi:hypothetical protein
MLGDAMAAPAGADVAVEGRALNLASLIGNSAAVLTLWAVLVGEREREVEAWRCDAEAPLSSIGSDAESVWCVWREARPTDVAGGSGELVLLPAGMGGVFRFAGPAPKPGRAAAPAAAAAMTGAEAVLSVSMRTDGGLSSSPEEVERSCVS